MFDAWVAVTTNDDGSYVLHGVHDKPLDLDFHKEGMAFEQAQGLQVGTRANHGHGLMRLL